MASVEDLNAPSVVAADGMLKIEAKPEGLFGPEETPVPLWCRGTGTHVMRTVRNGQPY
jgi:hypothetical protein